MADALEIVEALLDLPESERQAELERACGGDTALRREVLELLTIDSSAEDFLEPGSAGSATLLGSLRDAHAGATPEVIGPYRVERPVGEGGFGIVYEARQTRPIDRRVALKVLKAGMDSAAVLGRFEMERRTLARLEHPNIARVLDAGRVPDGEPSAGRPYFAMEFVEGTPITAYATEHGLGVEAIVGLVLQVCAAAQHAHGKGVIHRDLKPGNILVAETDGEAVCKVIDFGIAKAIDEAGGPSMTAITSPGSMIGTPQYMSPEQARGDDLDTRSDVYSLGVVLYELLTGTLPFEIEGRRAPDPESLRRMIETSDPAAPSSKPTKRGATGGPGRESVSSRRVRGDLDWITLRAMEKDPDRRYPTVAALAEDLRRFIRDEPVEAGPPSRSYRMKKFVRRNRVGVVAGAVAGGGLLAGSVFSVWFGVQAEFARMNEIQQRRLAERNAAVAEAVNEFLNKDLLSAVDPTRAADRDITMREVLDIASEKVGDRFSEQPLVEVAIRGTLAQTYERIGYAGESEPHRRRLIELLTVHAGEDDPETLTARASLVTTIMDQSRFDEAIELLTANIEMMRGRPELADELVRSQSNLAAAYLELGRFGEAAPILAETLEQKRAELGDRDPSTLTSIHNLAGLYFTLGELDRSERFYREAYEGRDAVLGEADPKTISSATMLGRVLAEFERFGEAESILNRSLEITRARLDPGHPMQLNASTALGTLLTRMGEYGRAHAVFEEALALREEHLGPEHVITLQNMGNLAQARYDLGRYEEALELLGVLGDRQSRALPEGHHDTATRLIMAGRCQHALGRPGLAEPLLIDGTCRMISALGAEHPRSVKAVGYLLGFYEDRGRTADADGLREARETGGVAELLCGSADG